MSKYVERLAAEYRIRQAKFYPSSKPSRLPIQEQINRSKYKDFEIENILHIRRIVLKFFGCNIKSKGRRASNARHMVYYIGMVIYGISSPKIAKYCGHVHHVTVLYGRNVVKKLLTEDKELVSDLQRIRGLL